MPSLDLWVLFWVLFLLAVRGCAKVATVFLERRTPTMRVKLKLRFWCTVDVG